jgi:hypothetical protein
VFLHWELSGPCRADIAGTEEPGAELVLRMLDLSEGTSRSVRVEAADGSHYADVEPGRTYGFELAVRAEGVWRTVCRTARIRTPAVAPGRLDSGDGEPADPDRVRRARTRAAVRGMEVPGLDYESTPLNVASSPGGPPPGRHGRAGRSAAFANGAEPEGAERGE